MSTIKANSVESLDGSYSIDVKDITPIGVGQTWQDVLVSRAFGVTYTNSTGRTIIIAISGTNAGGNRSFNITIGGVLTYTSTASGNVDYTAGILIAIPNGVEYILGTNTGTPTLTSWFELR